MIAEGISGPHQIASVIESVWPGLRVLVVGDGMLDKYIWGEVERISPEAPIAIVKALRTSEQPGGAANVAVNLAELGAQVTLAGFRGDDPDGEALEQKLGNAGILGRLVVVAGRPTISKTRILAGHQQMLRLDVESSEAVPAGFHDDLLLHVHASLESGVSVVVLSDYAKGVLNEQVCRTIIQRAKACGIPVVVDPKGRDYTRYRGATLLCPNLAELALATGTSANDLEAVLHAGEQCIEQLDIGSLAVTMSERGIMLLDGKTRFSAPARARQVFDVSGAGDTVTGVLALCMATGIERMASLRLANLAAGIVVGKRGTAPVRCDELIAELSQHPESPTKIFSMDQLVHRVDSWRAAGDRIVFTNGCFDLLHAGHIALLEDARRHGDRLVVALNNDQSVRGLKGLARPINNEQLRARSLAAISAVDAVVIFQDATPLSLVKAVRPDVLVKGADYRVEEIIGAPEVQSWGGEVVLVPLVDGLSTTRLLAKVCPQ